MSILVYRDQNTASSAAALLIAAELIERPSCVLGLDCAEELRRVFAALVRMTNDGMLDWSEARAFLLSEHVESDEDASFAEAIAAQLLDPVNLPESARFVPNTDTSDWSIVCNDYENEILRVGGLDTVLLSVCKDGSVASNFASTELAPVMHVERTEAGRILTAGLTTIMSAKRLVVLITGGDKARIAPAVLGGPIVPQVPASYLQLHQNAVFLLDEDAAVDL